MKKREDICSFEYRHPLFTIIHTKRNGCPLMDLIYILFSLIIFTYPLFKQFLDTLNCY